MKITSCRATVSSLISHAFMPLKKFGKAYAISEPGDLPQNDLAMLSRKRQCQVAFLSSYDYYIKDYLILLSDNSVITSVSLLFIRNYLSDSNVCRCGLCESFVITFLDYLFFTKQKKYDDKGTVY